ncbi:recombinase family protein [Tabrizicola sp. J26]|uniref:recombinase family protein n=1 Tax=Alitabrizicola rongguiensis TaxID=2909234 RepID=UPI001F21BF3D|nr:recombinase family protein [Tabrizicola rongguiensis]MCF1711067.1 recombinase family protein [Tabrizicola rongguiensis]
MTRAVLYARYSSDLQSAASIPDQVRLCQKLCAEQGWTVVDVFADEAMSGASHLRPQFQALQQAAMNGQVDVIVAEALDRLSRDQEHVAALYKRMQFLGVRIVTKAEGEINELHIGLGGTMSALFLKQLAQKTHRGLEGRVRSGKAAGGLSYGYRMVRSPLPDGSFTRGDRAIDPGEAAIVTRIFRDYAAGKSARTIAIELNREGIAPPRASAGTTSSTWSFSTISGNWKRGTGILNNELYIGKLVWNRQRFVKDPSTGKRQARPNPPEAWITEDVPHLRIIADDLWHRVKLRQGAIRETILTSDRENAFGLGRRPTYLFSGLLKCGCCGAGYTLINKVKYGCSAARNRGTCGNRAIIHRDDVEARVLNGLRERLLHPDLLAEFIAEYHREWNRLKQDEMSARTTTEGELRSVRQKIEQIVTAITEGMFHPSMKARMDDLEARRATLEAQLAELGAPEEPIRFHPGLAETYRRKVADLASSLNAEGTRPEAIEHLRALVSEIRLHPDPSAPGGHVLELFGELGAILALGESQTTKPSRLRGLSSDSVVAGAGFEPAAFRL